MPPCDPTRWHEWHIICYFTTSIYPNIIHFTVIMPDRIRPMCLGLQAKIQVHSTFLSYRLRNRQRILNWQDYMYRRLLKMMRIIFFPLMLKEFYLINGTFNRILTFIVVHFQTFFGKWVKVAHFHPTHQDRSTWVLGLPIPGVEVIFNPDTCDCIQLPP